ncbi:LOW QUALITY PROTEIN: hypothetical protein TorRG33x02_078290 [Trema orientale]|uniref:Uncharacterized protein n=1 Tax=Trema orientale TaxID=63057 RepID=A0A2P5FEM5_TREOI|nr:LOW QUALITY PROTEIN: hypothetical protein TorRG33x02_078290 [Trema orientale]
MLLHIRKLVKLLNITADAAAIDYIEQVLLPFSFYTDSCRNIQSQLNAKIICYFILYIHLRYQRIARHFLLHATDSCHARRGKRGKEAPTIADLLGFKRREKKRGKDDVKCTKIATKFLIPIHVAYKLSLFNLCTRTYHK